MGYAIPISDVTDIINDLMNQTTKSKVDPDKQGYIGIKGVDVDGDMAKTYNMPEGVYISEVMQGGGAEKAGLEQGDIITKIDGSSVSGMDELKSKLTARKSTAWIKPGSKKAGGGFSLFRK